MFSRYIIFETTCPTPLIFTPPGEVSRVETCHHRLADRELQSLFAAGETNTISEQESGVTNMSTNIIYNISGADMMLSQLSDIWFIHSKVHPG
jgi:hypothetical protein